MTNFNRMTILPHGPRTQFAVFKMKPDHDYAGSVSGGGHRKTTWRISAAAAVRFVGSHEECKAFVEDQGAVLI